MEVWKMVIKPLSDVNTWPEWIIRIFFVPKWFRLSRVIESFSFYLFKFSMFTSRLSSTMLDASIRGYKLRGWYEPLEDGGFILGVLPKHDQRSRSQT